MHIKPGTWEPSTTVCEPALCDPALLVPPPNPEPHIRNQRLSPGSGSCGGGGGGCVDKLPRRVSPPVPEGPPAHTFIYRRDRDRRGQPKGRGLRREALRGAGRVAERPQRHIQKDKWVENSMSLLRPPPAFPVQDSPAKLQPAVSYASKVKSGGPGGVLEDRPGLGVLLQNQWGLSFLSEILQGAEGSEQQPATENGHSPLGTPPKEQASEPRPPQQHHDLVTPSFPICPSQKEVESSGDLLLSCRHLVEALHYHTHEWDIISKQQKNSEKVVWYNSVDQPA